MSASNEGAQEPIQSRRNSLGGVSQTREYHPEAFAKKIGWSRARLNELISGRRKITAEMALDLAEALGTSAKLWMNLQATYERRKSVQ
jgi:addiction module HigA family antidote